MKRFTEILSGSAAVLFQVALTGWMFALSEVNFDFTAMELNYILLSAVMLGAYYLNTAIMRRGVPVPLFVIIELIMVAAGIFVFVRTTHLVPYETRTVVMNCIVYCLGFAVTAFLSWMPTNQNGILLRFDALAIMTVVMLVLDHVLVMPGAKGALNMCYFCLALTVISAISLKSGALAGRGGAVEGNPALGRIMLFVVAGIIALLAIIVVAYASSGVKSFSEFLLSIISVCVSAVKAALMFLYSLLERFVNWLAQFMEDTPMEGVGMPGTAGMEVPEMEDVDISMPVWIYYVLAGVAAAVLAYILFRLRRLKTVKVQSRAVVVTKLRRESGLAKALKEMWERLKAAVRFRWNCLRYRRSAPGLLIWCEKKAPEELARRTDESGERFLLRLGLALGGEAEETLITLAGIVEKSFYSPRPQPLPLGLYKAVKRTKFEPTRHGKSE